MTKAQHLTAAKKMAREARIQTFVQLIKFGGYRQFSVPNPPLLLAAKRYLQVADMTMTYDKTIELPKP